MSNWTVAPALETLRLQLNTAFPNRSKISDGGIGDERHQKAGTSDHLPNSKRVVCARDFTHDPDGGIDCHWLAKNLVANKDPRIKYLIWDKKICSSKTSPWKWRPYSGVNAHRHHLHISVGPDALQYNNPRKWDLDLPADDIAKVFEEPSSAATSMPAPQVTSNTNEDALASDLELSQPAASPQLPPTDIVPDDQTQPAVTNTTVEKVVTEETDGVAVVTKTTAETVAAPVEVQKESPSWMVKIAAPFTALAGLGINAGSFIQTKLEEMTIQQIGYMVAALGLVVLAIYWWQKSAKAAQARTMQLVEKAANPELTTVTLVK